MKNKFGKKLLSAIGIIAILLCGVVVGKIIGDQIVASLYYSVDYSAFTEAGLQDNKEEILTKYNNGEITFAGLKDGDASSAYIIALDKMNKLNYYQMLTYGTVSNPLQDQSLTGDFQKNGDVYSVMELSAGLKPVSTKMEYNTKTDECKHYQGTISSDGTTGIFNKPAEILTGDEFKNKFGTYPTEFTSYIVSSKTIESVKVTKSANKIKFELKLNKVSSVIKYVKQIMANSGLGQPTFNYVNFSFEIDSNFNLLTFGVDEEYVVKFGIMATCHSQISGTANYTKGN